MNIFRLISIEKWRIIFLIQKDNSLTFFMRQKKGTFFQNLSLFDNWSCSTYTRNFIKNFIYQLSKMEDYLGKKLFLVAGFIILGVKKWTFFRLISIESEELSFNSKDNSLTFFMRQKEGNVFFKIRHFLITGRVVLHKKFYKKFHLPVIKNGRLFRQKTSFGGWIYYSRVKKWTFFRLISIEKWRIIF